MVGSSNPSDAQALVNGLYFWKAETTFQRIKNQIFSLFTLMTLFSTLVQLIIALFADIIRSTRAAVTNRLLSCFYHL